MEKNRQTRSILTHCWPILKDTLKWQNYVLKKSLQEAKRVTIKRANPEAAVKLLPDAVTELVAGAVTKGVTEAATELVSELVSEPMSESVTQETVTEAVIEATTEAEVGVAVEDLRENILPIDPKRKRKENSVDIIQERAESLSARSLDLMEKKMDLQVMSMDISAMTDPDQLEYFKEMRTNIMTRLREKKAR